ncbi:MAG: alpha/beta hydrolase, partial [Actinobacteria bacterium]
MPGVTIDGFRMRYRERGEGPVALLVHGFPLDSTLWLDQIDALCDVRRVVAPDLRGFGRSGPSSAALSMERHADDLAALADHLDAGQVDLVGLSMGGYVALAFADRHPGRIRSLALLDTKTAPDDEKAKANRDTLAIRVVIEGRGPLAKELMASLLAPDASTMAKARLRTMAEGTPVETMVAALEGMKLRPDRSAVLASMQVPVLVVVGEHDRLAGPDEARAMAASVPGAEVVVIPGAGHLTPIE